MSSLVVPSLFVYVSLLQWVASPLCLAGRFLLFALFSKFSVSLHLVPLLTVNRPDVEESILAMEELMTALQDQLNEEKIMTSEAAFYKGVSYQKLVREIKEMKITSAELQKKVDGYKRSTRGKSKK